MAGMLNIGNKQASKLIVSAMANNPIIGNQN
jgi:hypothetical protein